MSAIEDLMDQIDKEIMARLFEDRCQEAFTSEIQFPDIGIEITREGLSNAIETMRQFEK